MLTQLAAPLTPITRRMIAGRALNVAQCAAGIDCEFSLRVARRASVYARFGGLGVTPTSLVGHWVPRSMLAKMKKRPSLPNPNICPFGNCSKKFLARFLIAQSPATLHRSVKIKNEEASKKLGAHSKNF
jgi:hypothetical protein